VAGVGLVLLLLVAALVEGRSVVLFGTVAPWSSPKRIHFCGRDYGRGGAVPATAAADVVGATPLQRVTRGPLWQPVYGHPGGARQRAGVVPEGCRSL
jgi:hypothetical protein